jgi:hypothetical protein
MMFEATTASREPLHRLLCRRYLLVVQAEASLSLNRVVGSRESVVRWGIGALSDGQLEFLGAWSEPDPGADFWQVIANDLSDRGVEGIGFLVVSDPTRTELAMRTSFPGVKVLCLAADSLRQGEGGGALVSVQFASLSNLDPRHRHIFRRTLDAANKWGLCLSRAVGRHGCFSSVAAARAFAADTLARAERDYDMLDGRAGAESVRAPARTRRQPGVATLSS